MNARTLFDFHAYLQGLTAKNRLARSRRYHFCTCSGVGYLEELLAQMRQHSAFVCLSDVSEDSVRQVGGGWFKRRTFTAFILRRYDTRSMTAYREAIDEARELFRQLHSRFIRDEADIQNELAYLRTDDVRSRELGGQFLNGCTGLYFMLNIDEPIDLRYDAEEWDEA